MCLCSGMAANCVEVHRKVPPTHVKYSTTTTATTTGLLGLWGSGIPGDFQVFQVIF